MVQLQSSLLMLHSDSSPPLHDIDLHEIFNALFEIYGKWPAQTNKHTHMNAQSCHSSVGLAQGHPNKVNIVR